MFERHEKHMSCENTLITWQLTLKLCCFMFTVLRIHFFANDKQNFTHLHWYVMLLLYLVCNV